MATSAQIAQQPKQRTWLRWLRTGAAAGTDLVFPPRCVACDQPCSHVLDEPLLCQSCREELQPTGLATCPRCAMPCPEADAVTGPCAQCRELTLLFDGVRTVGLYQGPLRQSILRVKHPQHEALASVLGLLLAERIQRRPFDVIPELVVPVSMFWLTRLVRGANAAETIAASLARSLNLPLASDLLVCRRYLRKQGTLHADERRRNVRNAFRASWRYNIAGAKILVVDDVLTTGATAHDAARALRKAGATRVFVAAVARGTGQV